MVPRGSCSVSRHLDAVGDAQEKRGFYAPELHTHHALAGKAEETWWGEEDMQSQALGEPQASIGVCKLLRVPTLEA